MTYQIPTAPCKPSAEIIPLSTGTCPAEWREFWHHERVRCGTNWRSIGETITPILFRLAAAVSS